MLGAMEERLKDLDKNARVTLFGQEVNPETYAIAKADMLLDIIMKLIIISSLKAMMIYKF